MKCITTIGSLPFTEPKKACDLVFERTPELPAWPQLPKKSFKENMNVQYSENFPGISVDEPNEKIYVSKDKFEQSLGDFYANYENFKSGGVEYFRISEDYASGFYEFKSQVSGRNIKAVKCQATGPVTFGMSVKDENGRSIYYDPTMRQVVEFNCMMKSIWQIKQLCEIKNPEEIVLFLDEPYLAAYGSAFTAVSKEDIINSISGVASAVKTEYQNIKIGVHCCANTDWSILCEAGIDIISFDAYEFFDNLILYTGALSKFVNKDGMLAWGIVPTNEESLNKETAESLNSRFQKCIDTLVSKGINKEKLTGQFLITPACGFGSRSQSSAENALKLLSGFNTK